MTQENKELLLKDLCARLPYGTFVYAQNADNWYDSEICTQVLSDAINEDYVIKPYLFPLSSMTNEHHLEIEILTNGQIAIDKYSLWDLSGCSELSLSQTLDVFDWLNRNHFDYRGLIEKGLAIDATGVNVY